MTLQEAIEDLNQYQGVVVPQRMPIIYITRTSRRIDPIRYRFSVWSIIKPSIVLLVNGYRIVDLPPSPRMELYDWFRYCLFEAQICLDLARAGHINTRETEFAASCLPKTNTIVESRDFHKVGF